ncbi:hypothetical protein [Nocardioides acrostichi]|uniref:Uncharacterized protein n=1 Tax=Nocardioides acrostichi TaxID=2784339 RepID=A0A930UW99_9ACTN|nr:hypothetical protein [Nocardioides acrostichi]MBF4161321.1 hypothetical protein [Nocardioides acrostichi]
MNPNDLHDRFERTLTDQRPPTPDVADLLDDGHRALRRRRLLATAGGTTATLAAAAVVGVLTVGGTPTAQEAPVAGSPAAPSSSASAPGPMAGVRFDPPSEKVITEANAAVTMGDDGKVDVEQGHLVVETRRPTPNPDGLEGLATVYRHHLYFHLLGPDGSGVFQWIGDPSLSLTVWMRAQTQAMGDTGGTDSDSTTIGPPVMPEAVDARWVRFVGDTEELEATDGARIVEQRPGVFVGSRWAEKTDNTAAAVVETSDGTRYFVLARSFDGKAGQYIGVRASDVDAADGGEPTLDDFLTLATSRYTPGESGTSEGLR